MTIYQMKESLGILGAELTTVSEQIRSKAADPATPIEELRSLKDKQDQAQERFNMLKSELDRKEQEERDRVKAQNPVAFEQNDEKRMVAAKAEMIRSAILGTQVSDETRNLLGAVKQAASTGGEKFLPTNMSNQLVSEPLTKNPLRGVIRTSNIKGLELPKVAYQLDDDGFIGDEDAAKEIALTGDKVTFGRNKFKVKARISDTVLHGSDVDLVTYVENALQSGLAAKEKKVAFAAAPVVGEEHMSFYGTAITEVTGTDLYKAVKNALAALHEDYRENAKVIMRYADYLSIIETLANGNATLFNAPPESIIGKPVIFSDSAVNPIVGDTNYAHLNYDGDLIYDTDKDVNKGEYLFVLTGWIDQQILLKSAFRIAKVAPAV